mgnify:FL=1
MKDYTFSKKETYDSKIKPLVKKIMLMCDEYNVPMFMTFAVKNSASGTEYVNEMRSAAACDTVLTNDRLVKLALILNDFEVVSEISKPGYDEELEDLEDLNEENSAL